ncbi:MAG: OmpH family outer membrane protein [Gammaproteobacteria bacterium]|nr:OmpH family outer membrane protein [Gammaproteobacteria bacterium]
MRKKIILAVLLGFSALGVNAEDIKIGFVNVPRILDSAPQAAKAKKELEKEFAPRDKKLVAMQKKKTKLEERKKKEGDVMSQSEQQKLERDLISLNREIRRAQEEFREDFNIRRNEELGKLQKVVFEAIQSLAKEKNFDLLVTDGVVFASERIDVTADIESKLKAAN